jgi:uncharacterized membrane protein
MITDIERRFKPLPNVIETAYVLLKLLNVPISIRALRKALEEHPDYPGLLCMSDVISFFGVQNTTIRVSHSSFVDIPGPFITLITGSHHNQEYFSVVDTIKAGLVYFYNPENRKWDSCRIELFLERWSGVAMIVEPISDAGEKEYNQSIKKEKRRAYVFVSSLICIPLLIFFQLIFLYVLQREAIFLPAIYICLLLVGGVLGTLLLWHEVDNSTLFLRDLCGNRARLNCNAILMSKASKIFGVKWSVIGASYFIGGLLLFLIKGISTQFLLIYGVISILATPYVFFSIYYQWRIAKQWCPLCLAIQFVLITQCSIVIIGGWITRHNIVIASDILATLTTYLLSFLFVNGALYSTYQARKSRACETGFNRLKHDIEVFESILKKQNKITINTDGLGITIGNLAATNKIVKVCNPYCEPCSKAHLAIEDLLGTINNLQIQIIFTSSGMDYDDHRFYPVSHLLTLAEKIDLQLLHQALHDWYTIPNKNYSQFALRYPIETDLKLQSFKMEAMYEWCRQMNIISTPTLFLNGYLMPELYTISDLKYLLIG